MSSENLIPLNKRSPEEARAIQAKGGATKSVQKDLAVMIANSACAKCKNCHVKCLIKESNLTEDSEMFCVIPEARGKASFYHTEVFDEGMILMLGRETLMKLKERCSSVYDLKRLHDAIMKQLEMEYPLKR